MHGMRSDWFVIGFTRGAHPARAEVIVRASGNHHAHRLAAYFAADDGSAVVLSGDCSSSGGQRGGLRVEAKFGHVPDNPQRWGLGSLVMAPPGPPLLLGGELTKVHQGGTVASRPPVRLKRARTSAYHNATLIAVTTMVALAISVTAIRAHADGRHTRLMEMARPHCPQDALSPRDLHRLVHHALVHGGSKHDAFFTVVAGCQRVSGAERRSRSHHGFAIG